MKLGCEAAPTNRSVPAKQASKMLYLLCSLGLVFTAIITSTFIRIVTGKLRMFRNIAVMAKPIFSTWYSCFQTTSFIGHITTKDPGLDPVPFMASFQRSPGCGHLRHLFDMKRNVFTKYTYQVLSLGSNTSLSNISPRNIKLQLKATSTSLKWDSAEHLKGQFL